MLKRLTVLSLTPLVCVSLALADDPLTNTSRLAGLENELRVLRQLVIDQGRRIEQLERQMTNVGTAGRENRAANTDTGNWKRPESWLKLQNGMTPQQVQLVLGSPTRTQSNIKDAVFWYYEGTVQGSGSVRGRVYFIDGAVSMVNPPVFLK